MKNNFEYFFDKIGKNYPFTLIDVGAMGGIPLKWDCVSSDIKIIAFEPDLREFSKLKDRHNIKYINCALSDASKDLKYYITKSPGKSSVFKPNLNILCQYEDLERFQIVQETIIPSSRVKSLDMVMEENRILDVDFIKLDTQGSELHIVNGGQQNAIPSVFGVEVEVEFMEMYERQPVFRHVDEFMDKNRFQLIDIRRAYWKRNDYYDYIGKGELIFGDALYFKKIDNFCRELFENEDKIFVANKILKAILICLIYKIYDYAFGLAKAGLKNKCFTDDEYKRIIFEIKKNSRRRFYLKSCIYNASLGFLQKLKPPSYLGWADGDNEIGNILAK